MAGQATTRKLSREEAEQQQADRDAAEAAALRPRSVAAGGDPELLRDLSRAVVELVELEEQRPIRAGASALRAVRRGLEASIAALVEALATRGHAPALRPIVAALVRPKR